MAAHQKKARDERAHLVLIDESGFFLNPLVRRTWAPRGKTPLLVRFGRHRDKVSPIAALSVSPQGRRLGLTWHTDPKNYLDGPKVVAFLGQLLKRLRGRVLVVWDNGRNHHGPQMRALLARTKRLHLEALPAYAPELNPVEWVWSHLKYGRLANFVPRHVRHLDQVLRAHLQSLAPACALLKQIWQGSQLPFPSYGLCFTDGQ